MFLYLQIVFCNKKILSVNIKTNAAKQLLSSKNSHLQLNNCPVRLSADRLEMPVEIAYYAKLKIKKGNFLFFGQQRFALFQQQGKLLWKKVRVYC